MCRSPPPPPPPPSPLISFFRPSPHTFKIVPPPLVQEPELVGGYHWKFLSSITKAFPVIHLFGRPEIVTVSIQIVLV